jgi:hypothetical protein
MPSQVASFLSCLIAIPTALVVVNSANEYLSDDLKQNITHPIILFFIVFGTMNANSGNSEVALATSILVFLVGYYIFIEKPEIGEKYIHKGKKEVKKIEIKKEEDFLEDEFLDYNAF